MKAEQELRAAENLTAAAQAETARHQTEIDRLAAEKSVLEEEKSIWLEIEQQSRRAAQALGDLQIDRDFLEARVHELQRALEDRTRLAKMRAHDRYGKLVELDEKPEVFGHPQGQTLPFAQEKPMGKLPVSLKTLVGQLRNNMAADGRYYTEKLVRTWLASLAAHRMQILKGVSGTGKTSLPIHFAKALGGPCTVIPVQSGWRDRADLVGFFNTFDNRLRVTPFSEAIYRANLPDFQDRPVFVVLDECNLSRVEYYAADLLSDLELDPEKSGMDKLGAEGWDRAMQHYRHPPHLIQICDQGENEAAPQHLHQGRFLALPPNVWIVGTANEDESTFEIADKTLDRAGILPMDSRATPEKKAPVELPPVSWSALSGAFTEAAQKCKRKDQLHDFVSKLTPDLEQRFEIGLGNRFEMQAEKFLPVYESSGGTVEEGIDHLLRTRVLRKVERIRDPGRVREIRELTETIQKQPWGAKCTESLDLLRRVVDRLEGRR